MENVLTLLERQFYDKLSDVKALEENVDTLSAPYFELNREFDTIARNFDMIYTYYLLKREDDQYKYLLASKDTAPEMVQGFGVVYGDKDVMPILEIVYNTQTVQFSKEMTKGQQNTVISAFLPLVKDGEVVGILGADYNISFVITLQQQAVLALMGSIALSITVALLLSLYINNTIINPVQEMKLLADAMAQTRFDADIKNFKSDEIGEMQRSMIRTRDNLQKALTDLKSERDEISAMKDNLKTGVFLMDKDMAIQDQYSQSLEQVLLRGGLQGKIFPELLTASLTVYELKNLQEYFTMMLTHFLEPAMLEDINPLKELNYICGETGEKRILHCGFSTVDRGSEAFILGTIDDITVEKELQQRLAEEEEKRQEDMRSLFEVVNVEPSVFADFIEDAEYGFDRINVLLSASNLPLQNVVVEIYQCVHAVKSNAVILGLESFGNKLHTLESTIKVLREHNPISGEDMKRLKSEFKAIEEEGDKIIEISRKISSFVQSGDRQNQQKYVLVTALAKTCNKLAEDLGKQVHLVTEAIDNEAIGKGPRRVMKEVLMQLIRNAVFHGIETPERRSALGKDPSGTVELFIKLEANNRIHLCLKDDGQGLDFDKIREKALSQHTIKESEAQNKSRLIWAIFAPGFSTAESEGVHAGRGIGLNLVYDYIQGVKGEIRVQTDKDKGTAFHIFIPAS
jgi:two-component system chemotaxis sensor kinase CheA